jgi:uncharacterized protein YkwD
MPWKRRLIAMLVFLITLTTQAQDVPPPPPETAPLPPGAVAKQTEAQKAEAARQVRLVRLREDVLARLNKFRASQGVAAARLAPDMVKHTQAHADKVARAIRKPLSEKRASGQPLCWQLNRARTGYTFCMLCCHDDSKPWAEVMAWQPRDAQNAIYAWETSQAGHRQLMTRGTEVGIGIALDAPQGPVWVVTLRTARATRK